MNREDLKCRDCGHAAPWNGNGWDSTDHADDCSGMARRTITLDHA